MSFKGYFELEIFQVNYSMRKTENIHCDYIQEKFTGVYYTLCIVELQRSFT